MYLGSLGLKVCSNNHKAQNQNKHTIWASANHCFANVYKVYKPCLLCKICFG